MIFPDVNYICLIYSRAARDACFSRYIALFLQLSASRYFTKKHSQPLSAPPPDPPENPHPLSADYSPCTQTPSHAPYSADTCRPPDTSPHALSRTADPRPSPVPPPDTSLPFSPDRLHRIPFPDIRIPPNQNPIHQIHHKHHTRTVNPIRRLPAPPVLASKIPLRTLHNLPPKLLFRPPLRNPLLHKKPLFRFSPQKPIRIQSFS